MLGGCEGGNVGVFEGAREGDFVGRAIGETDGGNRQREKRFYFRISTGSETMLYRCDGVDG